MDTRIRLCTTEEALTVLRDPTVLPLLSVYPEGLKDVETCLVDEKLLAVIMPQGERVEVHIACPFRHRAHIRNSMLSGLDWLKSRGFSEVFTTAPDSRKALVNMLKSLGFEKSLDGWVLKWA